MNALTQLHGNVLTPHGWTHGSMVFDQRIRSIDGRPLRQQPRVIDEGDYILPGFIDLHVHGGGGRDVMEGGDAVQVLSRLHARHGTTSLLATTMTAPLEELEVALKAIRSATDDRLPGHARVLGVHLEGPYINPGKLGAQPDFAIAASLEQVDYLDGLAPIKLITIAPEVDGHLKLVCKLAHRGMKVQIGHTAGSYDDGVAALAHGASGFTHLFNAMSGFHHRAPGMVGAALAHAQYAELIPDLLHVHPGAIRAALRSIPRLFCVTDSTAAAGMPDGDYALGRQVVHKCAGGVRLDDGTLAGSVLTMDQALRNLIALGMDVAEASLRTSTYAADYLGLADRGRLATGHYADVVVLDRQFALKAVYVEGEEIDLADA
ncbi:MULTISPECIES: N-acetylglucosamine-6-phosphate deacetylase [Herbaspirillum]|uniref:N-acetylglucosamine-6-phosphate deacetylase n=1 Tax=Herbaspirillum huttiense subsp. lycopersici TaxID=3074428 RepID=A0ABU2EM41_9BURK|nr:MULTISPECIES: N-acetylglucosamine-6-phosphate deacetylase [Herbaspirillum]MBP1317281.1 N-acetylglucosamine-6-phosphate deacetylase [Herbaspirillum sp. 1130]MDR9849199.1 N-acetylglucosamine-6-phosphate deacetylase [Herbaspirillum huttiense SE1]